LYCKLDIIFLIGRIKKINSLCGILIIQIFDYLYEYDESKEFQLICLMTLVKYNSLPCGDREVIESIDSGNVEVKEVKIKNPNNPVKLVDGVILVFKV